MSLIGRRLQGVSLCVLGIWVPMMVVGASASWEAPFQKNEAARQHFQQELVERRAKEKADAVAWAQNRGLPLREQRGKQWRELMAIRDGVPIYYITFNANAAISTAADQVRNTSPYFLNGEGITVGLWDGGSVRNTHQEFGSRVTLQNASASVSDHATHVCGTIAASGVVSSAKGMAPSVSVDSYDWDSDLSEMSSVAATAAEQSSKIYLSNHSYGIDASEDQTLFGRYLSDVRSMDTLVYGHQYYLPFVAAGNDRTLTSSGYDTIDYYGIAKNVITIGAVSDAVSGGVRSISATGLASFSSCGPADDGRIKPDVVANGTVVYSSLGAGDSDYGSYSGTSMATPNACGSAALLVEYYKTLFDGGAMRASTLKGLLIHTADDLGNTGPDYQYGYGLINIQKAADFIKEQADDAAIRMVEEALSPSDTVHSYTFVGDGIESIRATLCWTDAAGSTDYGDDDRSPDLVNDLDLRIEGPDGTIFYPYSLSYANPSQAATTDGENNVDNVEQVYIANPVVGEYTVWVDYDGSLQNREQVYSLLLSGNSADSDGDGMTDAWERYYFGDSTSAEQSADPDGDGADNYSEYVAGTSPLLASDVLKITSDSIFTGGSAGNTIQWSGTSSGRVYSVSWTANLIYQDFELIASNLPYTQTSFTDTEERSQNQIFYRVEVAIP